MTIPEEGFLLRIFVGESDRHGRPASPLTTKQKSDRDAMLEAENWAIAC